MKRLILASAALILAAGVASAGWNLKQKDDGSAAWESSGPAGTEAIEFTRQGNVWSPDNVYFFDDFLGDTLSVDLDGQKGSDAQALVPTVAGIGGLLTMVAGDVGSGVAADNSMLAFPVLSLEADNGGLFIETKCQLDAITNVIVNIGFTDVLASTTEEIPLELNTATITSTADDAVAAVFDTGATNDTWHLIGVKNTTDTLAINTALAPVAATYQIFRLEVNAAGDASLFINGKLVAAVDDAVTITDDLTPILIIVSDSAASRTMTCDYLMVGMTRS